MSRYTRRTAAIPYSLAEGPSVRRAPALLMTVLCCALLASCAAAKPAVPGLTASPTSVQTASAAPTPSPTGIVEMSDPELGFMLDDIPQLSGDEAQVYNWIATYEREFWRTLKTNVASPAISVIASPEVSTAVKDLAQSNVDDKWVIDGVERVRISAITVDGDSATGSVCRDFTGSTATADGHPLTAEAAGSAKPLLKQLTLRRVAAENRWIVQTSTTAGTC